VVLPGGLEHIQNQARTHRGPSWRVRTHSKPGKNISWSFLEDKNRVKTGQEHTVVLPGGLEHIQNQARTHHGPFWRVRTHSSTHEHNAYIN